MRNFQTVFWFPDKNYRNLGIMEMNSTMETKGRILSSLLATFWKQFTNFWKSKYYLAEGFFPVFENILGKSIKNCHINLRNK